MSRPECISEESVSLHAAYYLLTGSSAMMREIKKFSRKTGEILILVQNTEDQMESLAKSSREQREEARAYFSRAEATLEEVHTTFMAQKMEQEEAQKGQSAIRFFWQLDANMEFRRDPGISYWLVIEHEPPFRPFHESENA